jgi:glyceraldehyde 3-phosphate dehydrogenase
MSDQKEQAVKKAAKPLQLGINGFGRIGRMVTRIATYRGDVEIVAINDPFLDVEYMAYLLRYDSSQGTFKANIKTKEADGKKYLVVNGRNILVTAVRDPKDIDWKGAGAVYVAECFRCIFRNW